MKSNGNDRPGRVTVPLQLVYDAIETADDTWKQYLDIEKMEIVSLPEAPFMGEYDEEDQELADMIEEGWHTRFFGLPTRFDIHEYSIMERFIWDFRKGGYRIHWNMQSEEEGLSADSRMLSADSGSNSSGMIFRRKSIMRLLQNGARTMALSTSMTK